MIKVKKYIGIGIIAVAVLGSCANVDDTVGGGLILPNQKMEVRVDTLGIDPSQHILTRMIYDDTVKAFNLGVVFMGKYNDPTMKKIWSGFATTFLPIMRADSVGNGNGYKVKVDSVDLLMDITSLIGTDGMSQMFNGYALNSDLSRSEDTVYYANFKYEDYIDQTKPLFRFRRSRSGVINGNSDSMRLNLTDEGKAYFGNILADTTLYDNDTLFYEAFKGLVIIPVEEDVIDGIPVSSNAILSVDLSSSYLGIHFHNYESETSSAVKDTLSMWFVLDDNQTAYPYPNKSVGMMRHDYTGSVVEGLYNTGFTVSPTYIQGFAGVTTELEFQDELFAAIEALRVKAAEELGIDSCTIFINQAMAYMELQDKSATAMDAAPSRLGMYSDFRTFEGIADYAYAYELSLDSYGEVTVTAALPYGGYLNRSLGLYKMNITTYIQHEYQQYMKGNSAERKRVIVAPTIYNPELIYYPNWVALKGGESSAPIKLKLTYTIIYDGQ